MIGPGYKADDMKQMSKHSIAVARWTLAGALFLGAHAPALAQPEFTKAFWDYLDILVSDARIAGGREILAKHKAVFDKVEKQYGVDGNIITAIWGVESNYGTLGGDRPVLRSTATLSCIGRRQAYFRDEFLSALEILHRGDLKPEQLVGSWAGAIC